MPHALPNLPLVVQIGFAGSRRLYDADEHAKIDEATFVEGVAEHLRDRLERLPGELGLTERHFTCGISQIAAGADIAFGKALSAQKLPHRIFLPQTRSEYLNAQGSSGADFTDDQREQATQILAGPHIAEVRTVSQADTRNARFEEVNIEIARVSDVVVCVLAESAQSQTPGRGGTNDLVRRAALRKLPTLVITVRVEDGHPAFSEEWQEPGSADRFVPPTLPEVVDALGAQETLDCPVRLDDYHGILKEAGTKAASQQNRFKLSALIIIGAHVLATLCAVFALVLDHAIPLVPITLGVELILLGIGYGFHRWLHDSRAAESWALLRLTAEATRSAREVRRIRVSLRYLFDLPTPDQLRPLLRTLNVLHLVDAKSDSVKWMDARERYLQKRVEGQIEYFQREHARARQWQGVAQFTFAAGSLLAIAATAAKLAATRHLIELPHSALLALGTLAILLPVVAVSALSLAAALDLKARKHTFNETLLSLEAHRTLLRAATSEHEFADLVLRTERQLFGEIVNWHSRRAYTGVT